MEAELKFEKEGKEGVAVVGTYLIDASRRLGVRIEADCGRLGLCDSCAVTITGGAEFLSPPTKAENEKLTEERLQNGERLACQVKIEKEGEVVIKTHERKEEIPVDKAEEYRKEFEELPLEQKIAQLVKLEAIALGETFNFILNSPSKIVGMAMDVMAQFGLKMEEEAKKATRPDEHTEKSDDNAAEADLETAVEAEEPAGPEKVENAETQTPASPEIEKGKNKKSEGAE